MHFHLMGDANFLPTMEMELRYRITLQVIKVLLILEPINAPLYQWTTKCGTKGTLMINLQSESTQIKTFWLTQRFFNRRIALAQRWSTTQGIEKSSLSPGSISLPTRIEPLVIALYHSPNFDKCFITNYLMQTY